MINHTTSGSSTTALDAAQFRHINLDLDARSNDLLNLSQRASDGVRAFTSLSQLGS
ncbi:hypothetical protein [Microbacterium aurum]|uniref:hypothetical protein n=1 Tax=Microbacterium aurum TaxID=36805 RepID=UPI0012F49E07|nr:hypothetical protein [Microbacterium aurum]MBM7827700.1 hypothetical protein [Microbacterium aurum]